MECYTQSRLFSLFIPILNLLNFINKLIINFLYSNKGNLIVNYDDTKIRNIQLLN